MGTRRQAVGAAAVVLVAGLACLGLQTTGAATFSAAYEAETGQAASPAGIVADTTASGGDAVRFTARQGGGTGCQDLPKAGGGTWICSWSDEFDGSSIDTGKWTVVTDDTPGGYGWNLGGLSCMVDSPQNTFVGNGSLTIRGTRTTTPITCAEPSGGTRTANYAGAQLWTRDKFSQTYGRYEMRAKLPSGRGFWPGFWTWPQEGRYNDAWAEIDIMEAYGYTDWIDVGATLHEPVSGGDTRWCQNLIRPDVHNGFHTYRMDWTASGIAVYYDDQLCHDFTWTPQSGLTFPQPFDQPMFLILDLAVGFNWAPAGEAVPSVPRDTDLPGEMVVDYVRVWR